LFKIKLLNIESISQGKTFLGAYLCQSKQ